MKPFCLPIILIIFDAIIVELAKPTTIMAVGRVDKDTIGVRVDPIIPLRKIVTGAAVNPNIWAIIINIRFLLYILATLNILKYLTTYCN